MKFEERSYGGTLFRPRPEIWQEPESRILLVVTPWGMRSTAKKVIQSMSDHILTARVDQEATSPFEKNPSLSPVANQLQAAMQLANERVFREDNREEYLSGFEVMAIAQVGQELAISCVGHTHIFLSRKGLDLQPIVTLPDLSLGLSTSTILPPLPPALLGSQPKIAPWTISVPITSGDQVLMVSRSHLPARLLALPAHSRHPQAITLLLSQHSQDLPFWLGRLEFE